MRRPRTDPTRRRGRHGLALLALALSMSIATADAHAATTWPEGTAAPTRRLAWTARVVAATEARAHPGTGALLQWIETRSTWDTPNVHLVLGTAVRKGKAYVKVLLKRRPTGSAGWIPARTVRIERTRYRVEVDLSARRLTLLRAGRPVLRSRVVIGAGRTPTPTGTFAVDAAIRQAPGSELGPRVIALAAYSETLRRWHGSRPVIGIHSSERLPGALGTAASAGCVRLPSPLVRRLVARLPLGAPVVVRR